MSPDREPTGRVVSDDAVFVLSCGHHLVGCRDSHPGQVIRSGASGSLYCAEDRGWRDITAMIDAGAVPDVA